MKVLLLSDDTKRGKKGDIVDVSDGYATSALIPMGKAIPATPKIIAEQKRKQAQNAEQQLRQKNEIKQDAKILNGAVVTIVAKAENGKLFGAVHARDVANAIKEQYNRTIKEQAIDVKHLKTVGMHEITLSLDDETHCKITLDVREG